MGRRAEASRRTPAGLGPHSEGRIGLVRGTSQALEECELPERMKEGRNGVRSRAAGRPGQSCLGRKRGGGMLRLHRPERSWGQRESGRVSDSAGWGAPPRLGGWELGGRAAGRVAGAPRGSGWAGSPARRLRREPEPERSQSSDIRAPANTCERPPGPAGGGSAGRRAGGGAGAGPARLRPARLRATWAEAPPLPGPRPAAGGQRLSSCKGGERAEGDPEKQFCRKERAIGGLRV